jgi:hypothetical protein
MLKISESVKRFGLFEFEKAYESSGSVRNRRVIVHYVIRKCRLRPQGVN